MPHPRPPARCPDFTIHRRGRGPGFCQILNSSNKSIENIRGGVKNIMYIYDMWWDTQILQILRLGEGEESRFYQSARGDILLAKLSLYPTVTFLNSTLRYFSVWFLYFVTIRYKFSLSYTIGDWTISIHLHTGSELTKNNDHFRFIICWWSKQYCGLSKIITISLRMYAKTKGDHKISCDPNGGSYKKCGVHQLHICTLTGK